MKLLLDRNLSRKWCWRLRGATPAALTSFSSGWRNLTTRTSGTTARRNGFTLVTKNTDMVDLCVFRGAPPRVIWLRIGNCTTELVHEVLERNADRIAALDDPQAAVALSLFRFAPVE